MGTLEIGTRRAVPSDARAIAEVHDESWAEAYAGVVPHGALTRMIRRRGERWWLDAIRRSTFVVVLEVGETVAGYATLGRNRVSTLPFGGEVYELYLKPEYQGVGFGEKLFLAARGELKRRGYGGTVVWVLADNARAIRFYQNAGGRAVAEGSEHFDGQRLRKIAYAWD